jgi:MOSC domain-containing protein YiiM
MADGERTPALSTDQGERLTQWRKEVVMTEAKHLTLSELDSGLKTIRDSPSTQGELLMIVCRPVTDQRKVVDIAELDTSSGLVGDNWKARGSKATADRSAHPEMQLTLINARLIAHVAQAKDRWPLAGDQLVVDMDLSTDNLPPGARLALGSALIEITAEPHTGCAKFATRFGRDALQWVNSPIGKELRLRGVNAKVVRGGSIKTGDAVKKV